MKKVLNNTARQALKALDTVLTQIDLKNSRIKRLTKIKTTDDTVTVDLPDYATYVDQGRKAGKQPPVTDIVKWLKRKRIKAPEGVTPLKFAYMIAAQIGAKGIKARPFIDQFADDLEEITFKTIDIQIDQQLKKI